MTTSRGGWTIFQRRIDGCVDFYLGWKNYTEGFGDLNGEFWLGLNKIDRLSKSCQNDLRFDLEDFENETRYAEYTTFAVAGKADKYNLTVGGFSGYLFLLNWLTLTKLDESQIQLFNPLYMYIQ